MTTPAPAAGLCALAKDYLALRRRLGFELDKPAFLVRRFAEYCDDAGVDLVTTQAVLDWVLLAQPVAPTYRWLRLNAARGFAGYLHVLDPSHQVPPSDLVPYRHDRPTPCIMTGGQVETLMDVAGRLRPALHAATFQTLIGLIAATGMRTCEAVRADDSDIDPVEGAMTLHGKNHRDRRIPLHPTTLEALADYQRLRDQLVPSRAEPSLLVNTRGRRLNADLTRTHFTHLVDTAGLGTLTPRPTLRALRHIRRHHVDRLAERRCRYPSQPSTVVGPAGTYQAEAHVLVSPGRPGTAAGRQRPPAQGRRPLRRRRGRRWTDAGATVSDLAPILQGFFRVKLIQQRDASPHTISSYRDAWRLLLHYAQHATGTPPQRMRLGQLDHELVTGFLHHLETERGNSARTRNNRLAAIHSLFRYAALHALDDAEVIQRVLAIESARTDDQEVPWLTAEEAAAVLAAPDRGRWVGRRDHAMMAVLLATGLRVSELLSLTRADARIQAAGSHIRCTGKGRYPDIVVIRSESCFPRWAASDATVSPA